MDGRGNVIALTDVTGNTADRYGYDLWGKLVSSSEAVPQRLRYAGAWYDQELGWSWMGTRVYDPGLERFLQPDRSQREGIFAYAYSGDDPVDFTDPLGHGCGICGMLTDHRATCPPPRRPRSVCSASPPGRSALLDP